MTTTASSRPYDGLVSRSLNRRLSRPIARALARTPATPNAVTVFSLGIACASLATFSLGYPIVGGLLAQAASVIDGVDGDLARITGGGSKFGAFFDSVVDRYSDALVLLGLTVWAAHETDSDIAWIAGFAALAGSFAVTYTRARLDDERRTMFDRGLTSLASRDVRMLGVMAGAIAGLGVATLIALAVVTNAVVALRIGAFRQSLRSDRGL